MACETLISLLEAKSYNKGYCVFNEHSDNHLSFQNKILLPLPIFFINTYIKNRRFFINFFPEG
jgi:hypothetical protein